MKKVIGLCLVVLLSSTSVFARENRRMDKRKMDPSARCEKMIADLKLDEKQAVEFRKLQKEYMEKAQKEREAMRLSVRSNGKRCWPCVRIRTPR